MCDWFIQSLDTYIQSEILPTYSFSRKLACVNQPKCLRVPFDRVFQYMVSHICIQRNIRRRSRSRRKMVKGEQNGKVGVRPGVGSAYPRPKNLRPLRVCWHRLC
ncbi:hypothetical protein E2C01_048209 [Portunus trituberculatus]|uniref:Uncharacterized protein n=1 Tax=Portunus trituberculatus TaxID=210409 RepID=A0A5B7G9K7_PORTR|nr:hypothetical protein [Portunus trituberculatus]